MKPLLTALAASAATALLVGVASPSLAAEPEAATAVSAPSITVHSVGSALPYRLITPMGPTGQSDAGAATVSYTCDQGGTDRGAFVLASTSNGFLPPTFGQDLICDAQRHNVQLTVSRRSSSPFTPTTRRLGATLTLAFGFSGADAPAAPVVTKPVRISFLGW